MMGQSIFVTAGMVSIVYIIIKYLEMKFIIKEPKPVKIMIRDTIIVYLSVVSGNFVLEQFGGANRVVAKAPEIFTNEPAF
jgi:hypothetical protein|tara:strand:+ start:1775 stop:2014 length:240 start_codon:yes stop_codon:yes gene_type:complete